MVADGDQPVNILREDRDQRADAKGHGREHDDFLAADAVRYGSEDERAHHQPKQSGAEHRPQRAAGELPFPREIRSHVTDGLGVKAVDEQHRGAEQQQVNLKPADRLLVDEFGNVNHAARWRAGDGCRSCWHDIPPNHDIGPRPCRKNM
jgi:hypothetical protein